MVFRTFLTAFDGRFCRSPLACRKTYVLRQLATVLALAHAGKIGGSGLHGLLAPERISHC